MQLDELARTLYAAAPGDFVATRDEFVRQARAAGDKELATALRALRRPTQSAWLVNLLVRERPELVDELLAMGAEFRGGELTRQRMTELSTQRRELLHRLVTEAQRRSEAARARFSDDKAREIEATFGAAMADQDAAEQVLAGRLTTALSYSGFGPQLQLVPSPEPALSPPSALSPRSATAGRTPTRAEPPPRGGSDTDTDTGGDGDADAGPSEEELRRQRIEARAAIRSAERVLLDRTRARDKAAARRDKLVQRRDDLRTELELVQSRLAVVDGELDAAEQATRERTEAADTAQRELERLRRL